MFGGIKTTVEGDFCIKCNKKVNDTYNFCPICGNALNNRAAELKKEEFRNEKIKLLDELSLLVYDIDALKAIERKLKEL